MKKIVVNGINLCTHHSGLQRYMIECLREIDKLNSDNRLNIEVVYPSRMTISCPKFQNIKIKSLYGLNRHWYRYTLPIYIRTRKAAYIGMTNDNPVGTTCVVCQHDLIAIKPEAKNSQEYVDRKLAVYNEIASKCKYIVTVSEYSKKDIVECLNVPEERVLVISNGWQHIKEIRFDDTVFDRHVLLQKGNYYYALGNILPHKNFKWILETAKRNTNDIFAIAGAMCSSDNSDEIQQKNVYFLGRVTDEENKSLMKHCKAFLHPAFLEGFGIPPMEALALGRPIIISNVSCLPEIYGGAAHYIDPYRYDYDLDLLLSEKVERAETVLDKYSWEMSGRLWYELFQNL